jgi:hypothetical protein
LKISAGRRRIALFQHNPDCFMSRMEAPFVTKENMTTVHSIASFLYLQFRVCDTSPPVFLSDMCRKVVEFAQKLRRFPSPPASPLDVPRADAAKRVAWSDRPICCLLLLRSGSPTASDAKYRGFTPSRKHAIKSGKEFYVEIVILVNF